uniref:Uncharacterized protein n=1 Tax=Fagus sylvatica TaxID=28930 RepID=A0A2N9FPJ4_FAGSY
MLGNPGRAGVRKVGVVVAGLGDQFGNGFTVHFGFGIDGGCWLWVAMVVAGMGRWEFWVAMVVAGVGQLGVLGSHGGYRRGSAG